MWTVVRRDGFGSIVVSSRCGGGCARMNPRRRTLWVSKLAYEPFMFGEGDGRVDSSIGRACAREVVVELIRWLRSNALKS